MYIQHTVETRGILELVFHVFKENELICAELRSCALLSGTFEERFETTIFWQNFFTLF